MNQLRDGWLLLLAGALPLSCVVEAAEDGSGDSTDGMATALPPTGGMSAGLGTGGAFGNGATSATGAMPGTGGVAGTGSGAGTGSLAGVGGGLEPGTGGSSTGGAGTGGTDSGAVNPSPGCGMNGRPEGGRIYEAGESWLVFPEGYDGNTPLPVLFGFHGCGSYNHGDSTRTTFWDLTRNSGFETDYVVAVPLASSGSCFDYNTDIVRAKALYDDLVNNHCVDMDRVFGSGHSSGAGFLTSMLTPDHAADFAHFNFRGIAPVAAWDMSIDTPVATMYIQGVADAERGGGNGKSVVDQFVAANSCGQDTSAYAVDSCTSSHDSASVNAGCVSYGSCSTPTVWCSHDDSAYSGTFHGIPCFYRQAVFDFFASL